jgi:hypothetical protein
LIQQREYSATVVEGGKWSELLGQFPDHTVFHTLPWLSAIAAAHGLEIVLSAVMSAAECVALWPCLIMRKGPLRIIGSPLPGWSTAYLGPLFAPHADVPWAMRSLLAHRALGRSAYFACKVIDQRREIDLTELGFRPVLRYETYRLDLMRSEEEIWSNVRHECRRHIRKATKQGGDVRQEQSGEFLDDYWDMINETFGRSGMRPPHNRRLLDELWDRLQPCGRLYALSAFHEGTRVASIIVVRDDAVMYNWGSASRAAFRHLSAPSVLQWEAIRLARRLEIPTYDLISTTGGAGKFKEGFGPHVVAMSTHWERCPSKILMAVKRRYERYLRSRQRLPVAAVAAHA